MKIPLALMTLAAPPAFAHEGGVGHAHPHGAEALVVGPRRAGLAAPGLGAMIPGEVICPSGEIELNGGREAVVLEVANAGDRPVQVGSHYHFHETNPALRFDRAAARGMRLDIPAGTAVRFEPGQRRAVQLVPYAGARRVFGFNAGVMGALE